MENVNYVLKYNYAIESWWTDKIMCKLNNAGGSSSVCYIHMYHIKLSIYKTNSNSCALVTTQDAL